MMGIEGITTPSFSRKLLLPFPAPSLASFCYRPSQSSSSESVMRRGIDMAEAVITKWNPEKTANSPAASLFHHNRQEVMRFIQIVNDLNKAMHFLLEENSCIDQLVRARNLMQIAMKRLEREFYLILSVNRALLSPESVSTLSSSFSTGCDTFDWDEDGYNARASSDTICRIEDDTTLAMADLRVIAECMISCGYAKECLKIYNDVRKSVVDEGLYRLGVERFSSSRIRKMDWRAVELRIQSWLNAVRSAVKILFNGERILCDHVFACSDPIRESCFTEITKGGATILFGFPEDVAKNSTKSPEKIFRALDMYAAIADHLPEIDNLFSFQSTIQIKSQALTSLTKLGEFTRAALTDFESTVLKHSTKSQIPAGGGIHQLTIDAMNYLSILADYSHILSEILSDSPPSQKRLPPQSYLGFSDSDDSPATGITLKIAWIILILLCKINAKAKRYKDVSLAYLSLANNFQYVVVRVRASNLKFILGNQWVMRHELKVKQFASNYKRIGWSHVIDCISSDQTAENVEGVFKKFNTLFDEAYRKQCHRVVPDKNLRNDLKSSIARNIVPKYRDIYNAHRREMRKAPTVRFTPDNLAHHLSDLFFGDNE